jgi:hypothetical protein
MAAATPATLSIQSTANSVGVTTLELHVELRDSWSSLLRRDVRDVREVVEEVRNPLIDVGGVGGGVELGSLN